eukprot:768735-Hanusia_phi.AAC.3
MGSIPNRVPGSQGPGNEGRLIGSDVSGLRVVTVTVRSLARAAGSASARAKSTSLCSRGPDSSDRTHGARHGTVTVQGDSPGSTRPR